MILLFPLGPSGRQRFLRRYIGRLRLLPISLLRRRCKIYNRLCVDVCVLPVRILRVEDLMIGNNILELIAVWIHEFVGRDRTGQIVAVCPDTEVRSRL